MRLVTVYSISKRVEHTDIPYVRFYEAGLPNALVNMGERDILHSLGQDTKIETARVERISHSNGKTEFIAIEPRLKKLMTLELEQQIKEMSRKLRAEKENVLRLLKDQASWWEKPWYERLWLSLKGRE